MKASDFLFERAKQLVMEYNGRSPGAHGGLKEPERNFDAENWKREMRVKLGVKDNIDDKLARIEKAISEMVGANKVRAIYEYAWELTGNQCEMPGDCVNTDKMPNNLLQIIESDIMAENLCGIIQEWAKLKGYEPR